MKPKSKAKGKAKAAVIAPKRPRAAQSYLLKKHKRKSTTGETILTCAIHCNTEGRQVGQLSSCAAGSVERCEALLAAMVQALNDGSKDLAVVLQCLESLKMGDQAASLLFLPAEQAPVQQNEPQDPAQPNAAHP